MPLFRFEGRLLFWFWCGPFGWQLQMVEVSVESQNPSTGSRTQVDPHLLECRTHAIFTQFRVFLELFHFLHIPHRDFASWMMRDRRFVWQTCKLLFDPALQRPVDQLSTDLQVSCNAFDRPALHVKSDNGQSFLDRVLNGCVSRIAALLA